MGGGNSSIWVSADDDVERPEVCTCQPQLDLLSKFHHLDAHLVYGEHVAEEIHHCTVDCEGGKYKIKHCGCIPDVGCSECLRKNKEACLARKMHAINTLTTTACLHLAFTGFPEEFAAAVIKFKFSRECPKSKGWYHLQVQDVDCSSKFAELFESLQSQHADFHSKELRYKLSIRELKDRLDAIQQAMKKIMEPVETSF